MTVIIINIMDSERKFDVVQAFSKSFNGLSSENNLHRASRCGDCDLVSYILLLMKILSQTWWEFFLINFVLGVGYSVLIGQKFYFGITNKRVIKE